MSRFIKKIKGSIQWLYPLKEQKALMLIALVVIPYFVYDVYQHSFYKIYLETNPWNADVGWEFYYNEFQDISSNMMYCDFLLLLLPNLYAIQTLKEKNNCFNTWIIQRISYEGYLKREVCQNFVKTFITVFLLEVYILLISHLLIPLHFSLEAIDLHYFFDPTMQIYQFLFSSNPTLSAIIYMILTSLGYTVYINFMLAFQLFIRNTYVFRISSVLMQNLLSGGIAFLAGGLAQFLPIKLVSYLLSPFMVLYLFTPGLTFFGPESTLPSIVWSFISMALYLMIAMILFYFQKKRWLRENV